MNIKEIKERKLFFESDVAEFISSKADQFQEETGVGLKGIVVFLEKNRTITGKREPEYMVTQVVATLDI